MNEWSIYKREYKQIEPLNHFMIKYKQTWKKKHFTPKEAEHIIKSI